MELEILYLCEKEYQNLDTTFTQSVLHHHTHPEISIIFSGTADYFIHNQKYQLNAGDLILLAPGTKHSVIIPKQTNYRDLHLGINCLIGELANYLQQCEDGFLILSFKKNLSLITTICDALVKESNKHQSDYELMLQSLAVQLLVTLSRQLENPTHAIVHKDTYSISSLAYPDKSAIVQWITDYIQQNYMKEISLEMFAKDMYLSQVYISKLFKEETGHSPIHFLIQTRLSVAKSLLETQSLPIKEVSRRVGYEDAYHFSKLFKKYYGYPPSDIKKGINSI